MFPTKHWFEKYKKKIGHLASKRDTMANLTPFMAVRVLKKKIGHLASKRDTMANLTPFMAVRVLITGVVHRST